MMTEEKNYMIDDFDFTEVRGISEEKDAEFKQALKDYEIVHLTQLLNIDLDEVDISGIGKKTLEKIQKLVRDYLNIKTDMTADAITEIPDIFTTGSQAFNSILGGGIRKKTSYSFFGSYATGKTNLALQSSIASYLPKDMQPLYDEDGENPLVDAEGNELYYNAGGLVEGDILDPNTNLHHVFWLDSEGIFEGLFQMRIKQIKRGNRDIGVKIPSRFHLIGRELGFNDEELEVIRKNFIHIPIQNIQQVRDIFEKKVFEEKCREEDEQGNVCIRNPKLIVFDSISSNLRQDMGQDEKSYHKKPQHNKLLAALISYVNDFMNQFPTHPAFIAINHAYTDTNKAGNKFTQSPEWSDVEYGGSALLHGLDVHLHLWNAGKRNRAKIEDAGNLPKDKIEYTINPTNSFIG